MTECTQFRRPHSGYNCRLPGCTNELANRRSPIANWGSIFGSPSLICPRFLKCVLAAQTRKKETGSCKEHETHENEKRFIDPNRRHLPHRVHDAGGEAVDGFTSKTSAEWRLREILRNRKQKR